MPWPLWIYSASALFGEISIEVKVHGPVAAKVLFAFLTLTWLYFLLKGVRWVWVATVGASILGFVLDLITGSLTWHGIAMGLIGLVLLLLPVTRRYFSSHAAAAAPSGLGRDMS
ncbi:MAG TPA: hypothetical protein VFP23_08415 [Solirubrobacterales bacterium]|nr:hypothetical protein [Solirubrobacterales bacterium]